MGFQEDGRITALSLRGFFLVGAELDLGDNDPAVLAGGIDQVSIACNAWPSVSLAGACTRCSLADTPMPMFSLATRGLTTYHISADVE